MRKIISQLFLIIISTNSFAQNADSIYNKVDTAASFPGGEKKWKQYLVANLNPAVTVNNGAPAGTYTVIIQFVVHKNGEISDIRPLTNHGYGMEAEALKMIKKGPKKWIPAILDGEKVGSYKNQPITFQVSYSID